MRDTCGLHTLENDFQCKEQKVSAKDWVWNKINTLNTHICKIVVHLPMIKHRKNMSWKSINFHRFPQGESITTSPRYSLKGITKALPLPALIYYSQLFLDFTNISDTEKKPAINNKTNNRTEINDQLGMNVNMGSGLSPC